MVQRGKVGEDKRIFWKTDDKIRSRIDYESESFKEKEKKLKIKER